MNTSATFPREKIIAACKFCVSQIEVSRQREVDLIIADRMAKKRFFGFGRNYTKEESSNSDNWDAYGMDELFWAKISGGGGQHEKATKMLNLAEKASGETINVTASDFNYIKIILRAMIYGTSQTTRNI
jgi:hypothetical protein